LRAAAQIQASVEHLDSAHGGLGIAARVGVAAGEPIAHEHDLHGMAVVIASRLCSAAASGEVLVQSLVAALVASRDGTALDDPQSYELKGVPEPVRASSLRWRELVSNDIDSAQGTPPEGDSRQACTGGASATVNGHRPIGGVPLPLVLGAYAGEPLIGRDREIGLLREATLPRAGRRAVLVLGEPGIGKTRHAAAGAADAHAGGALVVLARCPPESVIPFEPWVRAIGELARAGGDGWCEGLALASGAELSALVPELSKYSAALQPTSAGEMVAAEGARYRLLHGIGAALAYAAGESPVHVILDDAHWCDAASAQALGYLLDSAPVAQLVLVVTARERELLRRHPVSRVLADLRRTGDLTELHLEGLDAGGMAALVAARIGRAITPRLAARLQARTAGNPFFAAELVRDLDGRGALRDGEALGSAPVPDAVTDLVQERLARLDPVTERLLVAVAAIGPSAAVALAARAAGIGEVDAQRAVTQAVSERLVDNVAAAVPTIAFPHALIREALTGGVDDATRAQLHLAIAAALESDADAEPTELARHYGLAVAVAGPERAIAAYKDAALAASLGHDHEQAAEQLRSALALLSESDLPARGALLLELGEQELLAADLLRAREAFRGAGDAARSIGDAGMLARAALGFAGGDIGFGWEINNDDTATVLLLREGLDALGEDEPRLALRMISRLAYALGYTDDNDVMGALTQRAQQLHQRLGDVESRVLAGLTALIAVGARGPDPSGLASYARLGEFIELCEVAQGCGRDDLLFRMVQWSAFAHYGNGRIAECERAIERAAQIAERLGSPRFMWEVELNRGQRLVDRGEREAGEALVLHAGATIRRLRPDIHVAVMLGTLLANRWIYDADTTMVRQVYEAMEGAGPAGIVSALATFGVALDGDYDTTRRRLASLLTDDLAPLRRPDAHVPAVLGLLTTAATLSGDRVAGERLRPLLEPLRGYVLAVAPMMVVGQIAELHIGRLELLAGRPEAAVEELRAAVARSDAVDLVWWTGWSRVNLAIALHRRNHETDAEQARAVLAEGEALAERHALCWVKEQAALARAELEGLKPPAAANSAEQRRPIRAITARTSRRALAAMVHGQDDETIERRFSEPRRQRALLRAMARGFQPAHSGDFHGVIAYELEPFAIQAPPEAPWRWAIQVDSRAGRARMLEPAPLDAAVTIHFGLAEWVRVIAGAQNAVTAMATGRCSIEGDVILAARLQSMFAG
jgi:hypothetical protein